MLAAIGMLLLVGGFLTAVISGVLSKEAGMYVGLFSIPLSLPFIILGAAL